MSKKKLRLILPLLVIVIALCVVIYGLPKVSDSMTKTVLAEYGTIEKTDQITCYFVRNERVYAPTISGEINYRIDEGTKIRKGTKVADIEQSEAGEKGYSSEIEKLGKKLKETSSCKAKINGVVSYKIDGNEAVMSTSRLKNISYDDVKNMDNSYEDLTRNTVVAGEPIYKIYKNEKWYMMFWTDEKTAENYTKGMSVRVRFEDGDVKAVVAGKKKQGGLYRIKLRSNRYYEGLSDTRVADATVVTASSSGLIIENTCICEEEGQKGVMVRSTTGEYVFTPINILLTDEKQSVISSDKYYDEEGKEHLTVNIYDELLRNP